VGFVTTITSIIVTIDVHIQLRSSSSDLPADSRLYNECTMGLGRLLQLHRL